MSLRIGIIAEDNSDFDVLCVLLKKSSKRGGITCLPNLTHGCGRMNAKCLGMAEDLYKRGCRVLIVARDSDGKNADDIKRALETTISPSKISVRVVVIPIIETEAWLLSDEVAIKKAFGLSSKPAKVRTPETITDPKGELEKIIERHSGGRVQYLNTTHNKLIASHIKISCLRRCASFLPFESFVQTQINVGGRA